MVEFLGKRGEHSVERGAGMERVVKLEVKPSPVAAQSSVEGSQLEMERKELISVHGG